MCRVVIIMGGEGYVVIISFVYGFVKDDCFIIRV